MMPSPYSGKQKTRIADMLRVSNEKRTDQFVRYLAKHALLAGIGV